MAGRVGVLLLSSLCAAGASNFPGSPQRSSTFSPGPPDPDTFDGVPSIDFETAMRVARASLQSGSSAERAVAEAELVLAGERPFASVSLGLPGGYLSDGWLSDSEARLALHEAVTQPGWEGSGDAPRRLSLCAPFPAWLEELARKLAPAFEGRQPDVCELRALEPGQAVPERCLAEESSTLPAHIAAFVSLAGRGSLEARQNGAAPADAPRAAPGTDPADAPGTAPGSGQLELAPGSCLLLSGDTYDGLALRLRADERHLSLLFRCACEARREPDATERNQ